MIIIYHFNNNIINLQSMKSLIKNRIFHILAFQAFGSFILTYGFCSAGLHVAPDVIVAASYFLGISLAGQITGGYINPVITVGTYIDHRHRKLGIYLAAQLLGAMLGAFWSWALLGTIPPPYKQGWQSIQLPKYLLNELIGSAFFTVCVLTLTNKFTSHAVKSWQIYLSVPIALFLVRKMTGCTVLNPAVGLCLQLVAAIAKGDSMMFVRDVWPLLVPSVIGSVIGALFMKRVYEPLLLFIKYRDLAEQANEMQNQEIQQQK